MNVNIFETIKREIELDIISEKYKNADKLPSIAELSTMYNIGKSTAQKILETLCKENIITKQRGVGYFVLPFVRPKLIRKYVHILQENVYEMLKLSENIGISEDELLSIIKECSKKS